MTKPKRIQRKRSKGWKLPPNTISVTRPGKWGNPFVGPDAVAAHARMIRIICSGESVSIWQWKTHRKGETKKQRDAREHDCCTVADQKFDCLFSKSYESMPLIGNVNLLEELRGKNLACFCAFDKPCHCYILLEIANR